MFREGREVPRGMVTSPQPFQYAPTCSAPACERPAGFKVAAPWSNGMSHELKNYGLACEDHRNSLLARAQLHQRNVALADGESVGSVGLYSLKTGCLDSALARLPDH